MACKTWIIYNGRPLAYDYAWDKLPVYPYVNSQIIPQMLKHSTSLRPHSFTVGLVLVVHILGGVKGAGYKFPLLRLWGNYHTWKPWIVFQFPRTDIFRTMCLFLNGGDRGETGNCLLLWILRVYFTRQNPPEACFKRQRGSGWPTLLAVKEYAAEDFCAQENVNHARNAEISIS